MDGDGSFDAEIHVPSPVKLLVSQRGIDQWIGGRSFQEATLFQLEAGRTISGIQFLQSGMRIELEVPYFRMEWTWFRLYDAATLPLAASYLLQNESDLVVGIANLRPGTYRMHVEPYWAGRSPWAPQWYNRVSDPAIATPITMSHEGEVVPLSVVLDKGGTIAGIVREVEGVSVDYYLYVTHADDPTRWGNTYGWSDQREFQVEGLPDGNWKVGVVRRYPGFGYPEQPTPETVWFPGTADWHAAGIITTRDFGDVTGIDIVMPAVRRD